jgi:steroid 5-alpha reductase family enzyme
MTPLQLLAASAAVVMLQMALLWLIQLRSHNANLVDVGWACGVLLIAMLHAASGHGYEPRRTLAAGMAGLWGFRLAAHFALTRLRGHAEEDGRYRQLRMDGQAHLQLKFLAFFQLRALLAVLFSLPLWLMVRNEVPELSGLEWVGATVWFVGLFGESVADIQLKRFKGERGNQGKICQAGLWRYSRHPNYFFDWLLWVGFALAALPSPFGWIALLCPALLLYLLCKVTGIPVSEAQALLTHGDAYRAYQRTTRAFVPWFPKR